MKNRRGTSATRGRGKRFRIGVIKHSTAVVQPEVKANFEASLKALSEFSDIDEAVTFPDLPYGPVVSLIVNAEGASAFRDLIHTGAATRLRAANDRWGGYAGSMVLAVDYLNAMRARGRMKRELDALYAKYDASFLYPFDAINRVLLVAAAWFFLKERATLQTWLGMGFIYIVLRTRGFRLQPGMLDFAESSADTTE